MQLAGELSKMNLASLIRLVRNSELTGKVCLTHGVNTAFIFFQSGQPIHVESDHGTGKEALLELFTWQSGTFSYIECLLEDIPESLSSEESLEKLLKEGVAYQEALRYLEQLRINSRTIFRVVGTLDDDVFLAKMDGRTPLGEIVQGLALSRSDYVQRLQQIVSTGKALVVEAPLEAEAGIKLPDWVISRLKQDNADVSQAIVDLVIWADRIKCWLFQADVDLQKLISQIDSGYGQVQDKAAEMELEEEAELEDAAQALISQNALSNQSSATAISHETHEPSQAAAASESRIARPPTYEF